jgi:hypothetical protein
MFNNWPNGADRKSQSRQIQRKPSLNDSLTQASTQKPYNLAGIDIANPNQTDNTFGEYMIDYGIIQNVARRRARSTNINRLVSANSQHKQNVSFGISQDVPSNLKEFASPKRVAHETSLNFHGTANLPEPSAPTLKGRCSQKPKDNHSHFAQSKKDKKKVAPWCIYDAGRLKKT